MKILTSMNARIYHDYGKDSLERFNRFLPPTMGNHEKVELVVYWDGRYSKEGEGLNFQIKFLEQVKGFTEFQTYAEKYQTEQKVDQRQNAFLWNAKRFACKAFAWGDYLPDDDVIWLDADVKIFDHVPAKFLRSFFKEWVLCTYLGRDSYSETGFVAFNHREPNSYGVRRHILEMYRTRKVFQLEHWTDCHVFDYVRDDWSNLEYPEFENLSPNGKGFDHVFNQSVLGRYMDHCKGPRKKMGYSPENHASADERDYGKKGHACTA